MESFYKQNFTLGVLGGGQLGRMLIQSAIDFNIDVAILDPDEHAPCASLATTFTRGDLLDREAVLAFGQACDVITIEIEKVNTEALQILADQGKKVFPEPHIISMIQDKRLQKRFYSDHHIPTAPYMLTESAQEIPADWLPAVHKLGRGGYDGRGVQILNNSSDLEKAFDAPGVLEKKIDFGKELAVSVARNSSGQMKAFPAVELVFHPEANLVEYLQAPAQISSEQEQAAQALAKKVIETLGMTGLLAVEMFLTRNGELLVNEIAPRTHNSGHHTIESNQTSQFEQHLRAVLNMPLGNTRQLVPAAMVNLLGEEGASGDARYMGLEEVLQRPGVHVHLYGKKITKPFRKMGHVTVTGSDVQELMETVNFVKRTLKVTA